MPAPSTGLRRCAPLASGGGARRSGRRLVARLGAWAPGLTALAHGAGRRLRCTRVAGAGAAAGAGRLQAGCGGGRCASPDPAAGVPRRWRWPPAGDGLRPPARRPAGALIRIGAGDDRMEREQRER
jgi:hypothetical protein